MASGIWESSADQPRLGASTHQRHRFPTVAGAGTLGQQGLGGLPCRPELLCQGPSGQGPCWSCRVFLRVMVAGGSRGWTGGVLSLCLTLRQTGLLSAVSAGPRSPEWKSDHTGLSPQCVPCTERSNPNTGHNVGDGAPSGSVQSRIQPPLSASRGQRGSTHCILGAVRSRNIS